MQAWRGVWQGNIWPLAGLGVWFDFESCFLGSDFEMRRLVVCFDGTWNSQELEDGQSADATNVAKVKAAIAAHDGNGNEQVVKYIKGVGTAGGLLLRGSGGAIGTGLNRDIRQGYRWLCDNFEAGDEVFIFGFSRGAYAARSLAGMVGKCGLLDFKDKGFFARIRAGRVRRAFSIYRDSDNEGADWREANDTNFPVNIGFLGVWDTVGSLGIPDFLVLNVLDRDERYSFHDTALGENVTVARHALAIDERRESFLPTLWTNTDGRDIKQIWFAGVHGDVGGSYNDAGLGDITLKWMMTEAQATGLSFKPGLTPVGDNPAAERNESLTRGWKLLPTRPRAVPDLEDATDIHESVVLRRENDATYWPTRRLAVGDTVEVDVEAGEKWSTTGLWLEAGKTYRFAATGTWNDASIVCGPNGTRDGDFLRSEIVHALLAPLRPIERWVNNLDGGQNSNLPLTPRQRGPWFKLYGAIAHSNVADDGSVTAEPHEILEIGEGDTFTVQHSGYFYAFANDAWRFYDNNQGAVQLSVTRL